MPGAGRVGDDAAGGPIVGVLAPTVFINGRNAACRGAAVAGHGKPPHSSPVMVGASTTVFCEGKNLCRTGDSASCGHPLVPGSSNVIAN